MISTPIGLPKPGLASQGSEQMLPPSRDDYAVAADTIGHVCFVC